MPTNKNEDEKTCCVCGEKAVAMCHYCKTPYCGKHWGTTVMTGNCCNMNEKDYE